MSQVVHHADKWTRWFYEKLEQYPKFLKYWDWYPWQTWGEDMRYEYFDTVKLQKEMFVFSTPDLLMARFFLSMYYGENDYQEKFSLFDVFKTMHSNNLEQADKDFILQCLKESCPESKQ